MNGESSSPLLASGYDTTTLFDAELRDIMWRRSRILLVLGLVTTSSVLAMSRLYALEPIVSAMRPWVLSLHLANPLSFLLALGVIQLRHKTKRQLEVATFVVIAFNVITIILSLAILYPGRDVFLPIALLLFVHAAFIPCRPSQVMLAGIAIMSVALAYLLSPLVFPEVGAYWAKFGSRISLFERGWNVLGVSLLALVSLVISQTLYSLHRTAHRAKRLGNYVLEDQIGSGGMGEVYRAQHAMICRPTAVKVVTAEGLGSGPALARFEREVQLSASLTHVNTITIFDYGRTPSDTFYYAMEYLDGMDVRKLVERFGPLSPARAIHLLVQACGSLSEAHARGIVHRDIKPSNLFVTHRGGVYDFIKVLDFGLARQLDSESSTALTQAGVIFGTPQFISPEALYGADKVDERSDIYNLGGVAFWMLTGQPVFRGSTSVDLIIDHVKTSPTPPSEVSTRGIPESLDAIVLKCLEKDPDRRFQTVEELETALQSLALHETWDKADAKEWWQRHVPEETVTTRCDPCSERLGPDAFSGGRRGTLRAATAS